MLVLVVVRMVVAVVEKIDNSVDIAAVAACSLVHFHHMHMVVAVEQNTAAVEGHTVTVIGVVDMRKRVTRKKHIHHCNIVVEAVAEVGAAEERKRPDYYSRVEK